MKRSIAALFAVSTLSIYGCGGGATGGPALTTVNPTSPSYSSLQFAVGTANIYGNAQIGLNVVSTLRKTDGTTAIGVTTPSLTGPFRLTAAPMPANAGVSDPYTTVVAGGPSLREVAAQKGVAGTPQTVAPGTPPCDASGSVPGGFTPCPAGLAPNTSTFGESGGVFAMGLAPANAVAETGQAYSSAPYAQPFYGSQDSTNAFMFVPWGGPPAFEPNGDAMGERDGASYNLYDSFGNPYVLGVPEGITAFDRVIPGTGSYTLSVAVSTVGSGGAITTQTIAKSAQLVSLSVLPTLSAPAVTVNGDGSASFTASLPPGVREALVQVIDFGPHGGPNNGGASRPQNCQGPRGTAFAPVYYAVAITNSAATTYTLPATMGPNLATSGGPANLQPSPTICTATMNTTTAGGTATPGDDIVVQMIGFDYPQIENIRNFETYPALQNPPIANGSNGQADITISMMMEHDNASRRQQAVRRAPHAQLSRRP